MINKDESIKGRTAHDGKPMREWLSQEESAIPMASTEGLFLTAMIDAHEKRDMMTNNVPNAYIQVPMEIPPGKERIMMKITGVLVDILIKISPETYIGYVVMENGKR